MEKQNKHKAELCYEEITGNTLKSKAMIISPRAGKAALALVTGASLAAGTAAYATVVHTVPSRCPYCCFWVFNPYRSEWRRSC